MLVTTFVKTFSVKFANEAAISDLRTVMQEISKHRQQFIVDLLLNFFPSSSLECLCRRIIGAANEASTMLVFYAVGELCGRRLDVGCFHNAAILLPKLVRTLIVPGSPPRSHEIHSIFTCS